MRKTFILFALLVIAIPAISQDDRDEYRTILDGKDLKVSVMTGPLMLFTSAAGEFGHMMGGGGAIYLNNFFFGGYGTGLTNQILDYQNDEYNDDVLKLGHGGFWMGYSILGNLPVHVTASTLIGFGKLGLVQPDQYSNWVYDQVFVLTPIVEMEINITRFLRIGAGATYSLYTGVNNIPGYTSRDLCSPGGFLSFRFGYFH